MKALIKKAAGKIPLIGNWYQQTQQQGAYPPGHFYSPVPDAQEVERYLDRRAGGADDEIPGINLNADHQFSLLKEYSGWYSQLEFPERQQAGKRYWYENGFFSYADAIFLHGFLCKHRPQRIIEVGSGFSSAAILDVVDSQGLQSTELTFIEPYPERLNSLLSATDKQSARVVVDQVQAVPLAEFARLQAGDLLFIDSSHVVKCGSDLQYLLFEVLPALASGVFVHFHDVFYPFEYPPEWLRKGRYWNENYFLRAFLAHNVAWSIYFFNTYVARKFADFISDELPLCQRNPGGSLYIRKQ
ncbi:MAG: class I SAM-dependent methyltransferase [Gammaproteobacteria bacterium]